MVGLHDHFNPQAHAGQALLTRCAIMWQLRCSRAVGVSCAMCRWWSSSGSWWTRPAAAAATCERRPLRRCSTARRLCSSSGATLRARHALPQAICLVQRRLLKRVVVGFRVLLFMEVCCLGNKYLVAWCQLSTRTLAMLARVTAMLHSLTLCRSTVVDMHRQSVSLSAPGPEKKPACCCAQLQAHTEHGYARQFIRGFKVADLVGSMGDLFDAALGDPSHSPLAALQAYGHAPPAAAQLDPSQVCCAAAGLMIEHLGTQHGIDLSDFCTRLGILIIAHHASALAAARCADTICFCKSYLVSGPMTCAAWLSWLADGCLTMRGVVCRARMHTWGPTCMVAPGHVAMLGGGAQTPLLLGLLQCRNSPNALRRQDPAKASRPSGCSLSLRRTHSEPYPVPYFSIRRHPCVEDRFPWTLLGWVAEHLPLRGMFACACVRVQWCGIPITLEFMTFVKSRPVLSTGLMK